MVRMRRRWPARINRRMGKTMIRQVLICIIILLIVIVAKKMDNAIVNNTYQAIKAQFTKEITFASIADSGMAFIGKFKEGTTTVVASIMQGGRGLEFSTPSDVPGTYSASANQSGTGKTLEFTSEEEIQVYAAAGGTVSDIGLDAEGNKYIKIHHGNDLISLYGGCTSTYVQPLEKVKRGQMIGSVAAGEGQKLRFEIWNKGKLDDPSKYIDF
ncbi:MAG: M23 family metallopeptidase [Bacillota bacterium]|nr:M23 family metallopeptidase [Bacillota bacterium]NLM07793.1 M23 family metallopeptidase [Clostridiales Family XIII bacterium]